MRLPRESARINPHGMFRATNEGIRMFRPILPFLLYVLLLGDALALTENHLNSGSIDRIPRVVAALEQGEAAERGVGMRKNIPQAITFYCDAISMGSPEGYFRVGRLLSQGPRKVRNQQMANTYLAWAALLGHPEAMKYRDKQAGNAPLGYCGGFLYSGRSAPFDTSGYLARQSASKQHIATFIRKTAPKYGVDPRLALSIALAESNLNANAVSPKNAQGVMQLIPGTQRRFGVQNPFNPEQNIHGGLAYLRWLQKRFGNNWVLVAAAYNAGEENVQKYGGIPPFRETQYYVRRVLYLAGKRH